MNGGDDSVLWSIRKLQKTNSLLSRLQLNFIVGNCVLDIAA